MEKAKTIHAEELETMDVVRLVVFTFITLGAYHGVWYLKRLNAINSLSSPVKLGHGAFGFIIAGCVVNAAVVLAMVFGEGGAAMSGRLAASLNDTSSLLNMAVWLVLVVQAFKVRRALADHFGARPGWDVTFSWLWTSLFTTFYLQYKINRLVEKEREVLVRDEG